MTSLPDLKKCTVSIIGLGYVGLPLAVEISKVKKSYLDKSELKRKVIGFDINLERINQLKRGFDKTNEIAKKDIVLLRELLFTSDANQLSKADVFIITVPTPITKEREPDFSLVIKACEIVGKALKKRNNYENVPIVIFESTVYPGATEEICIPVLRKESKLNIYEDTSKEGFAYGYSPERVNPGDHLHRISSITKVTSGNNIKVTNWVDNFYGSFIEAGTFKTKSIMVAEAAKVIENTQRDINIALINELSIIFTKMNIDTLEVLEAAKTKWNFLPFQPGLVGGHCIGVDPYYLTYKSQKLGYQPKIILAGRKINEEIADFYVEKAILKMIQSKIELKKSRALVLGLTFKENCPDIRNTQVTKIIKKLNEYHINYDIVDPIADNNEVMSQYNLKLYNEIPSNRKYNLIIVAVSHDEFVEMNIDQWVKICNSKYIILDIKGIVPRILNIIRP